LGLLGGNLLGIIDLSQQQFVVGDVNGDLKQVQVYYNSGLGVSLGSINWVYSQALANSFGYNVVPTQGGNLLTGYNMNLVITATDGSALDNQEIMEFLGTVRSSTDLTNLTVLPT